MHWIKSSILTLSLFAAGSFLIPTRSTAQTAIRDLSRSQDLTIAGRVTSVVGNSFTLDDGTGTVIVDAGPRWWQAITVEPGESLRVTGEMDNGEFDAFSITKADGSVIQIRPASGPPPWAGRGGSARPDPQ